MEYKREGKEGWTERGMISKRRDCQGRGGGGSVRPYNMEVNTIKHRPHIKLGTRRFTEAGS